MFAQWPPAPGHTTLDVWPHGAPGAPANPAPEADTTTAKENLIAGKPLVRLGNVSVPTLTLYTPPDKNTGAAVVVFPGGGYRILAIDLEGTEVCDWLTSLGITCVLLKYRVPDTGPFPKSAAALQDAQRALGIVRSFAAEWNIDPKRIGVLDFQRVLILRLRSALILISGFTIPSMPPTRSVAGRILP
jgi:acetyl esterase/lipase